jgi:hypothetical protein
MSGGLGALRNAGERTATKRVIRAEALAACPFSIAHDYATDYLRRAEAGHEEAEVRVPIRFLPTLVRHRVTVTFDLHLDVEEAGRTHAEIRLHWDSGTPLLPDFHGTVRFRIAGSGTLVLVNGSYRAPFGSPGRLFDHLIGRHIAWSSVRDLARRLAKYLETREEEWLTGVGEP